MRHPQITTDTIKDMDILSRLSPKEIKEIERHLYFRQYKKGQMLFFEGDPRERIYVIVRGYIRLERTNSNGSTRFDTLLKPTNFFPYEGLFYDEAYSYSAEAFTDVEVLYLPTYYMEEIIKKNKKLLLHLVKCLTDKMVMLEHRLQSITNSHASQRVVQIIGYLAEDLGEKQEEGILIPCPITIIETAKLTGTTRETVSHVLKKLKKEGKLESNEKRLFLKDSNYFLAAIK
ncbi:Crp/Fnr family transcriptional regulator [Bacillus sp. FJAT-47783]|uniref:Crp/Fnr family transcriptional regulator n=1 Tax=Bacillus sp. FJAT-47783 TaxID=2922712 RepID=UPI001FAD5FCF|nr:Crp/Fnr family transcriptional regulator [Bacillus sp. FJAT-47783]